MIGASDSGAGIPRALAWAYQAELNRQADRLFWQQTGYKPNQRLDPADPHDHAMIPTWWAVRSQVAHSRSPRELIRERASTAVIDMHTGDPQLVFVHATGPGGSETRAFPALADRRIEDYVRDRLRDSNYVAIFNAADSRWPQPIYETYPTGVDQPTPSVSGEATRGRYGNNLLGRTPRVGEQPVIYHDGLVLRPLTPDVAVRFPDIDPARRDAAVAATNAAWIDFQGNRQPARLLRDVCQPGDVLYYWDGPWAALAGSRGIAVVRRGVVVETFTTVVS